MNTPLWVGISGLDAWPNYYEAIRNKSVDYQKHSANTGGNNHKDTADNSGFDMS